MENADFHFKHKAGIFQVTAEIQNIPAEKLLVQSFFDNCFSIINDPSKEKPKSLDSRLGEAFLLVEQEFPEYGKTVRGISMLYEEMRSLGDPVRYDPP